MKYIIDNDLHIHTKLSGCSNDPLQTTERLLQYAIDNNLKTICVNDHFWDEKAEGCLGWYKNHPLSQISQSLPLPQKNGVRFLFGCETELNKNLQLGLSKERYDVFDFIVIPTTHMHLNGIVVDPDVDGLNANTRAKAWIKRLDAVLDMELPFYKVGIAHLACSGIGRGRDEYKEILSLIPEKEMKRLFRKASGVGVAIEINYDDMIIAMEEGELVLKMFRIAKECGCKFYLGSDAHHPVIFEKCIEVFQWAIDVLGLTEEDKHSFCKK